MTAPALVLLGYGSHDPRVAEISAQIRAALLRDPSQPRRRGRVPRPLRAQRAAGRRLAGRAAGSTEVVLVPLLLSDAFHAQVEVPAVVAAIRAAHPDAPGRSPPGRSAPRPRCSSVIDRRLRDALRARRVSELDGLVFAAAGSADVRSNAIVARRARQWATHHRLPHVTAFATGVGPDDGRGHPHAAGPGPPPHRRRQLVPRPPACCSPGRPSWPTRPAPSPSPTRWAPSPRSPRSPWSATSSRPWTSSTSTPPPRTPRPARPSTTSTSSRRSATSPSSPPDFLLAPGRSLKIRSSSLAVRTKSVS